MLPALLTAFLFAGSGICGQRSAMALGPLRANAIRLGLAVVLLGAATALLAPVPFHSPALPLLLLSGLVGFGVGDIALFLAYPRLGARLTLLINLCLAPVFGAAGEWLLLDTRPTARQGWSCLVILLGVVIALGSRARAPLSAGLRFRLGLLAAVTAGAGQGIGAVLTRMAKARAAFAGDHFIGISEAWVRSLPGFALALVAAWLWSRHPKGAVLGSRIQRSSLAWVVGAALFGPVLGVSCFQWALGQTTSAVVLSITATTPILVIPLAAYVDGDKPSALAVLGAVIAVTGVILVLGSA